MSERIEILGLNHVRRVVEDKLGWIWRPMDYRDHGIDGLIELGDEASSQYRAYGSLIGVQVKSGGSYVRGGGEHFTVTFSDQRWYDYWTDFAVPVIVVVYDPTTGLAYWNNAENCRLSKTGKTFSLMFERRSVLDLSSRARLILTFFQPRKSVVPEEGADLFLELTALSGAETGDQHIDDEVRRILMAMQNRSLQRRDSAKEKSFYAIDTTLEDFDAEAWFNDLAYRKAMDVVLEVTKTLGIQSNVRQIYSLRAKKLTKEILLVLWRLVQLHLANGIAIGLVRRSSLSRDLDRDFSIVNKEFVLECSVREWAQSVPQFTRSAVRFYLNVFEEVSATALWIKEVSTEHRLDALMAYFEFDKLTQRIDESGEQG